MSRLDRVMEWVKESRKIKNKAWIYAEDGKIRDDVICGDVMPLLEELKEYEIGVTDEYIEAFKRNDKTECYYTYNYNTNVDKDIVMWWREGCPIVIMQIHLGGDATLMWNTDFAVKVDGIDCIYNMESTTQIKDINGRYGADIELFSEVYSVYDYEKGETVGDGFYQIEVADLLEEIAK